MASLLREPMHGKPAHESPLCLDCHAPGPRETDSRGRNFDRSFGVGCEACHGPAGDWLNPHTTAAWQRRGWERGDADYKTGLGMSPMKDLAERVSNCVTCHAAGELLRSEVNHDLLAAGHPRLVFEFSSLHARLPKHWRERATAADPRPRDRDLYPDWDTRAWLVGQFFSASEAMQRLTHHSFYSEAKTPSALPWPEFADLDCRSCHQPVRPTAGVKILEPTQRFGSLAFSEWRVSLLPRALELAGVNVGARADLLRNVAPFSKENWTVATVRESSVSAMNQLFDLAMQASSHPVDPAAVRRVLREIINDPKPTIVSWDRAAQTAFAIQALQRTLSQLQPKPNDAKVTQLANSLVETVWPTGANGRLSDSYSAAKAFSPTRFGERLKQLREAMD
jgi:hypothetical protein